MYNFLFNFKAIPILNAYGMNVVIVNNGFPYSASKDRDFQRLAMIQRLARIQMLATLLLRRRK